MDIRVSSSHRGVSNGPLIYPYPRGLVSRDDRAARAERCHSGRLASKGPVRDEVLRGRQTQSPQRFRHTLRFLKSFGFSYRVILTTSAGLNGVLVEVVFLPVFCAIL